MTIRREDHSNCAFDFQAKTFRFISGVPIINQNEVCSFLQSEPNRPNLAQVDPSLKFSHRGLRDQDPDIARFNQRCDFKTVPESSLNANAHLAFNFRRNDQMLKERNKQIQSVEFPESD